MDKIEREAELIHTGILIGIILTLSIGGAIYLLMG